MTDRKAACLTAMRDAMRLSGIDIDLPWEGDLDDLEAERFRALLASFEALDAHLSGALSSLLNGEEDGWRPISEAPKDGTPVWIADAFGVSLCAWLAGDAEDDDDDGTVTFIGWMVLTSIIYGENEFVDIPMRWRPVVVPPAPPSSPDAGRKA